jgi:ATP-dependent helicase/nuclease subunit A
MSDPQRSLFDDVDAPEPSRVAGELQGSPAAKDLAARRFAVDPRNHVVLEASAGTGKTSVLVERYINLLRGGVEPANILAITFTRKAAAEMRERIVRGLRAAARSESDRVRWSELRDRLGEIAISTIDAFCLSLLREFPLEADLDPGFDMADETEVPRLVDEALDRALRVCTHQARSDADIALVLAQLGVSRTRAGLSALLARRLVAWDALNRFLANGPADLTAEQICRRTASGLLDVLRTAPGGLRQLLADGPVDHPRYQLLVREIDRLSDPESQTDAALRSVIDRVCQHFLTGDGKPRKAVTISGYRAEHYPSPDGSKRHRTAVMQLGEPIARVVGAFRRDLNVVLARGVRKMFAIALAQYRRALDARSVLDFSDVLERAVALLRQMDEFSQSRYRLESRYHHVLVDEFQDTSRAQWELVSLLIESWGEGVGVAAQPSIFIVGDRKQSIYRFRDAEVAVLDEAARYIEGLRPGTGAGLTGVAGPRRAISWSFRAVPELLAFVNDVFAEVAQPGTRPDDFRYEESDRFPVSLIPDGRRAPALGISAGADPETCAAAVAAEIERLLREDSVRDTKTGVPRSARAGDIAILFRSRASHREFEQALEDRGIPTYVYKGLGFFDADEIKDVSALMRYLANPDSDLRAAAFLRSRFVRLSDAGLAALAPALARALSADEPLPAAAGLSDEDQRVLEHTRRYLRDCLPLVDRIPPAELIERVLPAMAYAYELRGPRLLQARENLKKMRGLIRRIQNRGYATLARIADYIDSLSAGDESNAVIEALDAVNLMTVHASKGLEFPIVFVVNLAKGASGPPKPMRVIAGAGHEPSVSIGPFASELDDAEREREKQETRRLLYVALTRARDRLHVSSALKDGAFVPGPGSLGEVLPESVRALFAHAATAFEEFPTVAWTGGSGHTFELRNCRPPAAGEPGGVAAQPASEGRPFVTARRAGRTPLRSTVTSGSDLVVCTNDHPSGRPMEGTFVQETRSDPRITGRLVHRLFEVAKMGTAQAEVLAEETLARRLLRPEERAEVADADDVIAGALRAWRSLRERADVQRLLAGGVCLHEVPFSLHDEATSSIMRGTIDCLVQRPDGSVLVLELKTGTRRPEHERQLATYVTAARALFPGGQVSGTLLYS